MWVDLLIKIVPVIFELILATLKAPKRVIKGIAKLF